MINPASLVGPQVVTVVAPIGGTSPIPNGTVATTPDHLPNTIIRVVTPLWVLFIRSARFFVQVDLGLVTAGLVKPNVLPASDFWHLLVLCSSLSVAGTAVCFGQNLLELLGNLNQKYPNLMG